MFYERGAIKIKRFLGQLTLRFFMIILYINKVIANLEPKKKKNQKFLQFNFFPSSNYIRKLITILLKTKKKKTTYLYLEYRRI